LLDYPTAVRELVRHLVHVHEYRRIAFIRGPAGHPAAEERYRGYLESMADCGLPVDPNLISSPAPRWENCGKQIVEILLDERGLRPSVNF
jgi:DNA-binding LacI/PurR family transcriptional regulator